MASTIQLSQFKTWVRTKLGDSSFDDASLTQFANETNREICNQPVPWPFMEKSFIGTITTGINTYAFPTDMQAPINAEITVPIAQARFLDFMPYKEFDQRYPDPAALTVSTPDIWTRFGGTWIIGPAAPDQTYTIQMRYIKVPTTTTSDASTLDIPDEFSELLTLGMYARALEASDEIDYAKDQYQKFAAQLSLMKQRLAIQQSGTVQVMQTRRTLRRGR